MTDTTTPDRRQGFDTLAVHAGAVVWAFAVRSAWRAAGGIAAAAAMLWLLLLLLER